MNRVVPLKKGSSLGDLVNDEQPKPEDDLRTRLHAMETKIRRMKEQRNSFNEDARRAADSRNALQEQSKEIRESIKDKLDEMLIRENRQLLVDACLSFLPTRVDLDLRGWENDIFSHSS